MEVIMIIILKSSQKFNSEQITPKHLHKKEIEKAANATKWQTATDSRQVTNRKSQTGTYST